MFLIVCCPTHKPNLLVVNTLYMVIYRSYCAPKVVYFVRE